MMQILGHKVFNTPYRPTPMRRMQTPSSSSRITGVCGETMEIFLRIDGETITDATYVSDGCASSRLCGSITAELARGLTVDDAALIAGDTLLMLLEELPREDTHCALLAAEALHAAIHNWMVK